MPDIRPEDIPPGFILRCDLCKQPSAWLPEHQHWHHASDLDSDLCRLLRLLIMYGAVDA